MSLLNARLNARQQTAIAGIRQPALKDTLSEPVRATREFGEAVLGWYGSDRIQSVDDANRFREKMVGLVVRRSW